MAIPAVLVTAVAVPLPANVALGPLDGAVKVTVTLATGLDDESNTFACNALEKDVPTAVDCGVPEKEMIDCGELDGGGAEPPLCAKITSTQ